MTARLVLLAVLVGIVALPAVAQDEAIRVVAVHPDRQLSAILNLFQGARVAGPPAALVAWKQATGRSLAKTTEAAITLIHPWNVEEFKRFDGADLSLRFDDPIAWWLRVPRDDGAIASVATALALTDGGRDEPIQGRPVDRLGPPGSAVMMELADGSALAASGRDALASALDSVAGPDLSGIESGFVARIRPSSIRVELDDSLRGRQALEMVRGLGVSEIDVATGLDGDTWFARSRTRREVPTDPTPVLDPRWLDELPAEGILAAGALAVDPRPSSWNTFFKALDLAIHADPELSKTAPIRIRLSTLTIPVGVALEAQVWPRIRGLSTAVRASATGDPIDGLLVMIYATDEASADRMARQVVPKLAKVAGASRSGEPAGDPLVVYRGRLRGRPLEVRLDGDRLAIGWGEGMLASLLAVRESPEKSVGAVWRSLGLDPAAPCHHAALFWPPRWPHGWGVGEPSAIAVESLGPIAWVGRVEPTVAVDEFRAFGLSRSVRTFLDRLPHDREDHP